MKRIIAMLLALMLLAGAALAETQCLNVQGSGSVYVQADRVCASLGVNMVGEDLAQLQQRANETIIAICDALIAAGLDEKNISTNYIYINPRYDYSGEVERMVGYTINNTISITTDKIDSVGSYIDAAFAAGANSFDSIQFFVSDDTAARKQALEIAVKDAADKAETIAAAAGQRLGQILEISEGSQQEMYYNTRSNSMYKMAEMDAAAAAGTTVRAAQINVAASVTISYALEAK